jgi:hypothetical protein
MDNAGTRYPTEVANTVHDTGGVVFKIKPAAGKSGGIVRDIGVVANPKDTLGNRHAASAECIVTLDIRSLFVTPTLACWTKMPPPLTDAWLA